MGIFKKIINIIFGSSEEIVKSSDLEKKSTLNVVYRKADSVEKEATLNVVHRKEDLVNTIGGCALKKEEHQKIYSCIVQKLTNNVCQSELAPINNGIFGFEPISENKERKAVSTDDIAGECLLSKESTLTYSEDLTTPKSKRRKFLSVVGQKKLSHIKDYLVNHGFIDVITCEQIFKVKSLRNFIWLLRKDGFEIETDKIGVYDNNGKKVKVTNYRLIAKKENGAD